MDIFERVTHHGFMATSSEHERQDSDVTAKQPMLKIAAETASSSFLNQRVSGLRDTVAQTGMRVLSADTPVDTTALRRAAIDYGRILSQIPTEMPDSGVVAVTNAGIVLLSCHGYDALDRAMKRMIAAGQIHSDECWVSTIG